MCSQAQDPVDLTAMADPVDLTAMADSDLLAAAEEEAMEMQQRQDYAGVKHRNEVQMKLFLKFATSSERLCLGMKLDDDVVKEMKKTSIIPKSMMTDRMLSLFLSFVKSEIKEKGNLVQCNTRATMGFMSYSLRANGMGERIGKCQSQFPKLNVGWVNLRKSKEVKEEISEQALCLLDDDVAKILAMPLVDAEGYIHRWNLFRRHAFDVERWGFLRGKNCHDFKEKDVGEQVDAKSGRRTVVFMAQGANQQKHQTKDTAHPLSCFCPDPTAHNSKNYMCPIAVYELYKATKMSDKATYVNDRAKKYNESYGELFYWRNFRYVCPGKPESGCYYTLNRVGLDKLDKNLDVLNDELKLSIARGVHPDAKNNKRRKKFTHHSNKVSTVCMAEEQFGDQLDPAEKEALGSHSGGCWQSYAKRGQITKKRAFYKLHSMAAAKQNDVAMAKSNEVNVAVASALTEAKYTFDDEEDDKNVAANNLPQQPQQQLVSSSLSGINAIPVQQPLQQTIVINGVTYQAVQSPERQNVNMGAKPINVGMQPNSHGVNMNFEMSKPINVGAALPKFDIARALPSLPANMFQNQGYAAFSGQSNQASQLRFNPMK